LRSTLRASLRKAGEPASPARSRGASRADGAKPPVERGTRVRVLSGPFVGKIGVVQDVDGKGGARVMLGLLATRLNIKDLALSTEGRERPHLATSHRKPLPGR
jgi:transcription antitermination factor NusG